MYTEIINSPLGALRIEASKNGIRALTRTNEIVDNIKSENPHIILLKKELAAYFNKELQNFSTTVDTTGYTTFQQNVWKALLDIEYGKTISYKELAIRLGDVKKIRAAGTANGRNPVPIVIPCHRVIGSDGSMVGYSGGIDVKEFLLGLEGMPIQGSLF